jgi:hypothetical protein
VAVSGISLAITASSACGVPGIAAFTFSFGLSSGIVKNVGGRSLAGTYRQGPVRPGARNQRPVTSTYVFWLSRSMNTFPVVFFT